MHGQSGQFLQCVKYLATLAVVALVRPVVGRAEVKPGDAYFLTPAERVSLW